MSKSESAINNLINGNIKEAREDAQYISFNRLWEKAVELGHEPKKATDIAGYLKGILSWGEYCGGF